MRSLDATLRKACGCLLLLTAGACTREAPRPSSDASQPSVTSSQASAESPHLMSHRAALPASPAAERTAAPRINLGPAPAPAPEGMAWVPGGEFWMGCEDCGMPDAAPVHLVSVPGFWMDRTPVTNRQFERFVRATRYVTVAERRPDPRQFPGAPPDALVPGAAVFTRPPGPVPLDNYLQWWRYVPGASWRHPDGPGSSLANRAQHPVVHIAWEDAAAYASWAGKRLPTEAEFEFAARGGLDRNRYAWGNDLTPGGARPANIFEGHFPHDDNHADGHAGTSPVTAFPANGYGLHDMGGNVWQWCADWYRPDYYTSFATATAHNPKGPASSLDPEEPGAAKRVTRGGSFLCSAEYCTRYLVGSRGRAEISTGSSNVGFRLVSDRR